MGEVFAWHTHPDPAATLPAALSKHLPARLWHLGCLEPAPNPNFGSGCPSAALARSLPGRESCSVLLCRSSRTSPTSPPTAGSTPGSSAAPLGSEHHSRELSLLPCSIFPAASPPAQEPFFHG